MLAQLDMIFDANAKLANRAMWNDDERWDFYALTLFSLINYHQWFNGWEIDPKTDDVVNDFFLSLLLLESILSRSTRITLVGFFYSLRLKGRWQAGEKVEVVETREFAFVRSPWGAMFPPKKKYLLSIRNASPKHYVWLCWLHVKICTKSYSQTFDADSWECFRWGSMDGQFHHRSLLFSCHNVALFVDFFFLSVFSFFFRFHSIYSNVSSRLCFDSFHAFVKRAELMTRGVHAMTKQFILRRKMKRAKLSRLIHASVVNPHHVKLLTIGFYERCVRNGFRSVETRSFNLCAFVETAIKHFEKWVSEDSSNGN